MSDDREELKHIAQRYGVGAIKRHVFLCLGPDCCDSEIGQKAWEKLKKELKEHGLTMSAGPNACYRTKASCLRICEGGPIVLVYPEGTWYAGMRADRIPLFVREHLLEGRPVEEWVFARNPLPADEPPAVHTPDPPAPQS